MLVKEFILNNKDKKDFIIQYIIKIFEDDFIEFDLNKVKIKINSQLDELFHTLEKIETIETNSVLFIVEQLNTCFELKEEMEFCDFVCKKEDLEKYKEESFTLWTESEFRIEHYCFDFLPLIEIANYEIYIDKLLLDNQDIIANLIFSIIKNGILEEDREKNKNKFFEEIKQGLEEAINGECISCEELFTDLEQEILDSFETDEEKEIYLKEKAKKEEFKERDNLFRILTLKLNHKKCISVIEEYMIEKYCV